MTGLSLEIEEQKVDCENPEVTLVLKDNASDLFRRTIRVFSEDDAIAVCDELTKRGQMQPADADQAIAALIEPIRIKWLRDRDQQPDGGKPSEVAAQKPQASVPRYVAVLPTKDVEGSQGPSIRDTHNNRVLANFVLTLEEEIFVQDDIESWQEFAGTLTTAKGTRGFRIGAREFADNAKLKSALFAAGGCELVIYTNMDELRRAISTITKDAGGAKSRKLTTNFGWAEDQKMYLTPTVQISESGIETFDEKSELRVDLGSETPACHLDLKVLSGEELVRVKRHVVEDLLRLSASTVTHTLLGTTAAAVLYPFAQGAGRFALWLVGLTGSGKSFAGKLFANFFGNFPISSAPFATWGSTANFIQRQGYFFKDAIYLVDDYKPELVRFPGEVVKVLQAYADNTARGRLRSDATANVVRPIRGMLVCTGEDVPDHNASAIGRSVIIHVPQRAKNVEAGRQCLSECGNYSGVMADFIRWLIEGNRMDVFTERCRELQKRFNEDVQGQQNDIRIATNLAILGAAFEQFAEYLGDVWEGWQEAVRRFVDEDLIAIRDGMLGEAKEQQASEVFLRTLRELLRYKQVEILDFPKAKPDSNTQVIGRWAGASPSKTGGKVAGLKERVEISMPLAFAAVNGSLRQQGRPELKTTERALLQQLREDGKLLDNNGQPVPPGAESTRAVRGFGPKQVRVFSINKAELYGDETGSCKV